MRKNYIDRIEYLDIAKGIAISLVVFAHIYTEISKTSSTIQIIIGSLHNPTFFIVSGILVAVTGKDYDKNNILQYVLKRFFDLMIPFLFWCFVYTGGLYIFDKVPLKIGLFDSINKLWFLPILFEAYCILMIVCRWKISWKYVIFIGIILSLFFSFVSSGIAKLFAYPMFFCYGYYWYKMPKNKRKNLLICAAIVWISLEIWSNMTHVISIEDEITASGWKLFTCFIMNFAGGFTIVFLAEWLERHLSIIFKELLLYLGCNSIYIYILHYIGIFYIQRNIYLGWYDIIISLLLCIFVPLIATKILRGTIIEKIMFKPGLFLKPIVRKDVGKWN